MALKALFYPDVPFDSLYIPFIYKEIYLDGIYVDICNQKRDMTILDVGANIGVVTQHLREYAKKLYALEPSAEHFEALKKNKEFNHWDNVEIFNVAVSDGDGKAALNRNNDNRTCHSLTLKFNQGDELVKTTRLDTFFKENEIEKIDFMKFDVEGAEDMIFRSEGFKNVADKITAMLVEFHLADWQETSKYLMELGFDARKYDCGGVIILFTH